MTTVLDAPPAPPEQPVSERPRQSPWKRRFPLLPALIFTIIVTQLPFVVTIVLSTLQWNILRPGERHFTGLSNYAYVLTDERMRAAVWNTVVLTAMVVIASMILGTAFALLLDRKFLGRGIVRTLLITPFLVMPIASALFFKHALYNPSYGLINGVLTWFRQTFGDGGVVDIDWVSNYAMIAVALPLIWQWTPFMMLIVLAGLQGQSQEVVEAARVDGAGSFKMFAWITLPHLRQYIELGLVLGTIYVVQTFDAVYSITQGGPGTATTTLPYEIYLTMFRKYEYGQAAAAGVVVVIITIVVATFALRTISSLFRAEEK